MGAAPVFGAGGRSISSDFFPACVLRCANVIMRLVFRCPGCQQTVRRTVAAGDRELACESCGWTRESRSECDATNAPAACCVCGCDDLWRQKDFPQRVGVALVATGALLSTIAWSDFRPVLAIGVLLAFAALDLVLYRAMRDVLVCYRCGARHSPEAIDPAHPRFDLETAERYRQERLRLEEAGRSTEAASVAASAPRESPIAPRGT
jgi:hypothetical protein